ncbi:MAG: toprim domain-containing protein, partial [Ornithinimicrobium sp.]
MWQANLDDRLGSHDPAVREWAAVLRQLAPATRLDPFTPLLSSRLCAVAGAGLDAHSLLAAAAAESPLPDDHAAGGLWWRISAHLSPAVIADTDNGPVVTDWTDQLAALVGEDRAASLQHDALWPVLRATIDQALHRGWQLPDLPLEIGYGDPCSRAGECQSLVWRISVLFDPPPAPEATTPDGEPAGEDETWWTPPNRDVGIPVNDWHAWLASGHPGTSVPPRDDPFRQESAMRTTVEPKHTENINIELGIAAAARSAAYPLEPTDAQLGRIFDQDIAWAEATVTRERLLAINTTTAHFYQSHLDTDRSWVRGYLHERFGTDVAGDVRFGAGHAPAGWTRLVGHLRDHGFTDEETLQAGVATVARTGRLIDRFRDRAVFPIARDGEILGFIGRRHPDLDDGPQAGPKYLNTADTLLFSKGAQLYIPTTKPDPLAVPVLVEGPMDAVAVTLATGGSYVGVAPLGTSFTNDQAEQLLNAFPLARPVVATDADVAGHVAAEKA